MRVMLLQDYKSNRGFVLSKGTIVKVQETARKNSIVLTKEGHYWSVPVRLLQPVVE